MRKILIALVLGLLLVPSVSLAATFGSSKDQGVLSVSQTEKAKNAYLVGSSINFAGKTAQDLIAAGSNISVIGDVNSSLMAAGSNITISGPVGQSVRVAGSNINLQNSVGSDFMAAGATVLIDNKSVISDDLAVAAGTLDLFGTVNGNAYITGGQINIDGTIDGNVIIKNAATVNIGNNAIIKGKLDYNAPKPANIAAGAQISGETNYNQVTTPKANKNMIFGLISLFAVLMLAGTFFILWLVIALMPKLLPGYVEDSSIDPWKKMGVGFIALVVTPIAAIFVMCTIIGLPLGILMFGAYFMILGFAKLIVPVFVGSYLFKWLSKDKKFTVNALTILVGIIVTCVISFIPFFGNFALFLVFLMALAQIVYCLNGVFKANR